MSTASPEIAVIGVGNALRRDDGVGIHAVRALARRNLAAGVRTIEAGLDLSECLGEAAGAKRLVIVDAVAGGGAPGSIYRFAAHEIEARAAPGLSLAGLGAIDAIRLARLEGIAPEEVSIVGVEPADTDWGTELSEPVAARLDAVVDLLAREVSGRA